jgi:predicted AAA+ superfamily ATPase
MLKRKITNDLLDWWSGDKKKALLVKGLRQVGKTYIIDSFCKEHYENYIYINFKTNQDIKRVFSGSLDVNDLVISLSANIPDSHFVAHKTIIFLDEIQECARARAAIKPFVIDGRYDVIASGSLLGLRNYNPKIKQNVPVGYEHIIKMGGLDFEEFLWAKGIDDSVISLLKDCYKKERPVPAGVHEAMLKYYREYIVVGGMPSIVNVFISTCDMNQVYKEQRDLIEEYKDDFGTHLDDEENKKEDKTFLGRIEAVFDSLPSQLSKDNKKFAYSLVAPHAKGREYCSAIE